MEEKKQIEVIIYNEIKYDRPFKWSDIKNLDLQDEDVINCGHDEGYYTENNSMDPHYFCVITRKREETDEEMNKRLEKVSREKKRMKDMRYQSYLKLKKEFESE